MFAQRAHAIQPTFVLDDVTTPTVDAICRRLDCLPLAIELAAARIKLFPPALLHTRLAHRLDVLNSGPRDLPARQQTLRSALAWSYELLSIRRPGIDAAVGRAHYCTDRIASELLQRAADGTARRPAVGALR